MEKLPVARRPVNPCEQQPAEIAIKIDPLQQKGRLMLQRT